MKLEIYQICKVLPISIVECDEWEVTYQDGYPAILKVFKVDERKSIIAIFNFNNIAGFKEIKE